MIFFYVLLRSDMVKTTLASCVKYFSYVWGLSLLSKLVFVFRTLGQKFFYWLP